MFLAEDDLFFLGLLWLRVFIYTTKVLISLCRGWVLRVSKFIIHYFMIVSIMHIICNLFMLYLWLFNYLLMLLLLLLKLSLNLFFIIPYLRQLPYLHLLVLSTCNQLLLFFYPDHLGNRACMCLQDIYRRSVLSRPESYNTVLTCSYDLTILIPPYDHTDIRPALELSKLLRESLCLWSA